MPQTYKHPPITEAIVEIRLAQPIEERLVRRAADRLRPEYSFVEEENEIEVQMQLQANPDARALTTWAGIKLISADRADITVVRPSGFSSSRLAPYLGWEHFIARAKRDWDTFRDRVGFAAVGRLGLRYINRIDVPMNGAASVQLEQVLRFFPYSPPELTWGPIAHYAMQVARLPGPTGFSITLNSATVPSPLVDQAAFVLDIDVAKSEGAPQSSDDIWALLGEMRTEKNRLFEACITDFARKRFHS